MGVEWMANTSNTESTLELGGVYLVKKDVGLDSESTNFETDAD